MALSIEYGPKVNCLSQIPDEAVEVAQTATGNDDLSAQDELTNLKHLLAAVFWLKTDNGESIEDRS